jgi:hypothetical protein
VDRSYILLQGISFSVVPLLCVLLIVCCSILHRAHKLVEEYPDSALAWFGVGCYYMAARQFEQSRCFFAKATQLDKHHAHSWIAFGHAFAEQVSCTTHMLYSALSCLLPLLASDPFAHPDHDYCVSTLAGQAGNTTHTHGLPSTSRHGLFLLVEGSCEP